MVKIPTARDVSYSNPRSGRIANAGPTPMVGAALADAGQMVVQASYSLQELADREKTDIANDRSNEVSTSLTRFLADEEQRFLDARENSSESGIGFTRQFMQGHQARANAFAKQNFEGLTKDAQTGYLNNILSRGNSLYEKATAFENETKAGYYDRTTNTNLDAYRTQIQNNAADFGDLKRQGLEAINSANMPEPWKAERRRQWEADAAESKWRWRFKQDPAAAVSEIQAPVGGRVGRAYQRFISKGWAPHQAAGIVGNLQAESGADLNTQARNAGDGSDGSDSIGVAQWNGRRAQALKAFAAERGTDWHDLDTQIDFIDHELRTTERAAGENLARSTTAEDAAAAFTGYERPRGWSASNARGSHNWTGRRDNALRIAGEKPQAEDADLDAIPYDRREQLAAWGENQYSQQRTKQRAAVKDDYSLLIATQPEGVRESVILSDPVLDNGDKADLVKTLHTAQKESGGVNAMISAMANGNVSVNPFSEDQTKIADKTYDKLLGGAQDADQQKVITSDFVARTGYIPKRVQAELRNGAASTDAGQVAQAMEAASVLQKNAPISFGSFDGNAAIAKSLDLYKTYTQSMGYSAEEAAKKLIAANDPEQLRRRDAILKSEPVKKLLKDQSAGDVAAIFDKGIFHAAPDVGAGVTAEQIQVGVNPEAEAVIVADYRKVLEEALVDANGDQGAAAEIAKRRFQTVYGTTEFSPASNNVVVRYPPEKAYPALPDVGHAYIRDQLAEAMKAEGIEADALYLQGDTQTEADIRAGKPARYQVFYEQGGKIQRFNLPFYANVDAARASIKAKQDEAVKAAEARMLENRATEERTYPEGRGVGRLERFGNDQLYRGVARENSPMGRAAKRAREEQDRLNERVRKLDAEDQAERDAWGALSPEEQRQRSQDEFLSGPFQKNGM